MGQYGSMGSTRGTFPTRAVVEAPLPGSLKSHSIGVAGEKEAPGGTLTTAGCNRNSRAGKLAKGR